MFCRKIGAERSVFQELCQFVILTSRNQLLLELSVYPFNTLQIYYRHIVDVHEEL